MSNPAMSPQSPQPRPFVPPMPRRIRKVGAPLAVIIGLGTITVLILVLLTVVNPVGTVVAFVLSTLAMTVVLLAYLWLDRWEPEPPRLLVLAFVWGASVAVVISVILEVILGGLFGSAEAATFGTVAIVAPVVEEAAKGLFLLIMMTGRRRNELNSLTDCLVYAGIVAVGFAWLEDIFYIADGATLGESLVTAALRLIMAPFAHPLFTTMIGFGVYFALQRRSTAAKAGCILLGYLGAVIMHGLWNGSSLLGFGTYILVYVLWMVPIFALVIGLAIFGRRREQKVVSATLPSILADGLITPNEATWLTSIRNRRLALAEAARVGGRPARKGVKNFAAQVIELAFVRDRIDRGFGDPRVYALQNEEAYWVTAARAAAPTLESLAAFRAPEVPGRRA